jgi:pilus assembly protein Flp/PilA
MSKYEPPRERLGKHWSRLMSEFVLRFLKSEFAATAIEYALIAAGILIAIVAAVSSVGTSVNAMPK